MNFIAYIFCFSGFLQVLQDAGELSPACCSAILQALQSSSYPAPSAALAALAQGLLSTQPDAQPGEPLLQAQAEELDPSGEQAGSPTEAGREPARGSKASQQGAGGGGPGTAHTTSTDLARGLHALAWLRAQQGDPGGLVEVQACLEHSALHIAQMHLQQQEGQQGQGHPGHQGQHEGGHQALSALSGACHAYQCVPPLEFIAAVLQAAVASLAQHAQHTKFMQRAEVTASAGLLLRFISPAAHGEAALLQTLLAALCPPSPPHGSTPLLQHPSLPSVTQAGPQTGTQHAHAACITFLAAIQLAGPLQPALERQLAEAVVGTGDVTLMCACLRAITWPGSGAGSAQLLLGQVVSWGSSQEQGQGGSQSILQNLPTAALCQAAAAVGVLGLSHSTQGEAVISEACTRLTQGRTQAGLLAWASLPPALLLDLVHAHSTNTPSTPPSSPPLPAPPAGLGSGQHEGGQSSAEALVTASLAALQRSTSGTFSHAPMQAAAWPSCLAAPHGALQREQLLGVLRVLCSHKAQHAQRSQQRLEGVLPLAASHMPWFKPEVQLEVSRQLFWEPCDSGGIGAWQGETLVRYPSLLVSAHTEAVNNMFKTTKQLDCERNHGHRFSGWRLKFHGTA